MRQRRPLTCRQISLRPALRPQITRIRGLLRDLRRHVAHKCQLSQRFELVDRNATDDQSRTFWVEHDFETEFFELREVRFGFLSQPDLHFRFAVANEACFVSARQSFFLSESLNNSEHGAIQFSIHFRATISLSRLHRIRRAERLRRRYSDTRYHRRHIHRRSLRAFRRRKRATGARSTTYCAPTSIYRR